MEHAAELTGERIDQNSQGHVKQNQTNDEVKDNDENHPRKAKAGQIWTSQVLEDTSFARNAVVAECEHALEQCVAVRVEAQRVEVRLEKEETEDRQNEDEANDNEHLRKYLAGLKNEAVVRTIKSKLTIVCLRAFKMNSR